MRKVHFSLYMVMCIILYFTFSVSGDSGANHNKDMEEVFFVHNPDETMHKNDLKDMNVSKAAQYLEDAAYLTIDQFSNKKDSQNGQKHVESLRNLIKDVPDISEIDVSATAQNHRQFSHLGWNSDYHNISETPGKSLHEEAWYKVWEKRKKIMEDTVEEVFDFAWWSDIPIMKQFMPDYGEQCDSMCALVYYVHLLGDHRETGTKKQYDMLLPLGGQFNEKDICHELMYHFQILFETQKTTKEIFAIKRVLSSINADCYKYVWLSDDKEMLDNNKKNAVELLDILKANVPKLMERAGYLKKMQNLDKSA